VEENAFLVSRTVLSKLHAIVKRCLPDRASGGNAPLGCEADILAPIMCIFLGCAPYWGWSSAIVHAMVVGSAACWRWQPEPVQGLPLLLRATGLPA
jgi:hypothetical protein